MNVMIMQPHTQPFAQERALEAYQSQSGIDTDVRAQSFD